MRDAFRCRAFWLLMAALILTKLIAMRTFGRWADSDECVVGIMAKHILEQGVHPLYYYGQPYGGGGSIEAHTAVLFYWLFGISSWSLKLTALLYTTAGAVLVYGLGVRLGGVRTGLCTLAVYITMPALIVWGLKVRGGYVVTLVLVPAILWTTDRILHRQRVDHLAALFLIALSVVSYWNMPSSVPLVLLVVVFSIAYWLWQRQFNLVLGYGAYLLAGAIGVLLWRPDNLAQLLSRLAEPGQAPLAGLLRMRLVLLARDVLQDFFQPYLDTVVDGIDWPAPVTLVLFVMAMGVAGYRQKKTPRGSVADPTVLMILLYVFFFLVCMVCAPASTIGLPPRYLFPLVPAVAIIGGLAITKLPRRLRTCLLGYVTASFLFLNVGLLLKPRLFEHRTFYDPAEIQALIRALDKAGVRFAQTTYVLQWRLLFETHERVIAVNLVDFRRFPAYRQTLNRSVREQRAKLAYVFRKDGQWARVLLGLSPQEFADQYLRQKNIRYDTIDADPYVAFVARPSTATKAPEASPLRRAETQGREDHRQDLPEGTD